MPKDDIKICSKYIQGVLSVDYKKLYLGLFNSLTDAIEAIQEQNYGIAEKLLIQAQQQAEEVLLEEDA